MRLNMDETRVIKVFYVDFRPFVVYNFCAVLTAIKVHLEHIPRVLYDVHVR